MKKQFCVIFTCIIFNSISFSQTTKEKVDTFTVHLESTATFSDCGVMLNSYGLKFKIANTNFSFAGIITCPEGYGKFFFIKGDKYQITGTKIYNIDSIYANHNLTNPYKGEKLPTYSIINVKKLK